MSKSKFEEFVSQVPQVISITVGATIVLVVLTMASCVMVISESGEEAAAELAAQTTLEKQRSTAIEKLISEHGINPIAARCAIIGWEDLSADRDLCEEAAKFPIIKKVASEQ